MERHFKPGTIIQHFKRETLSEERLFHEPFAYMYKVIGEGMNTETKEKLLIYQALYGSNVMGESDNFREKGLCGSSEAFKG